jgi:hypothetical protein
MPDQRFIKAIESGIASQTQRRKQGLDNLFTIQTERLMGIPDGIGKPKGVQSVLRHLIGQAEIKNL